MTLIYGIVRREPVIILGQALPTIIYTRNIMLIMKNRAQRIARRWIASGPSDGSR